MVRPANIGVDSEELEEVVEETIEEEFEEELRYGEVPAESGSVEVEEEEELL